MKLKQAGLSETLHEGEKKSLHFFRTYLLIELHQLQSSTCLEIKDKTTLKCMHYHQTTGHLNQSRSLPL